MSGFERLPSVEALLVKLRKEFDGMPEALLVREARRAIDEARDSLKAGGEPGDVTDAAAAGVRKFFEPSLRRVINATGVVLHTNLGRAPLATGQHIAGYSNLEYSLRDGGRGKRDDHLSTLLRDLLGDVAAIAVNNNAAATYLVLNTLAAGKEVLVSRGELIEIGEGFRIPDILRRAGALLREVGTTNKTHIEDYRSEINDSTALILRVHPSNFHMTGFTSRPALRELVELGVPVYDDLGSGCLVDLRAYGIQEPLVQDSLAAGAAIVSFSGDKLMGGPQAGIIAGKPEFIGAVRKNPMYRTFRLDKLAIEALEWTLRYHVAGQYERIPALAMLMMPAEKIRERAERLAARVRGAYVKEGVSVAGGGSTPDVRLPTWLVAIRDPVPGVLVERLLAAAPPVIVRIEDDAVVIDLRTVSEAEEEELLGAIEACAQA